MKIRTLLIASAAALISGLLVAQAQVPGVNSTLNSVFTLAYDNSTSKPTYSATAAGLTAASSASDICTLAGSATKTIRVRHIFFNGYAATAMTDPIAIVKRSTVDTAGTSVLMTKVPLDSSSSAATAVAEYYTANGTLGTLVGVITDRYQGFAASTGGNEDPMHSYEFGLLGSPIFLRGAAQQIAINLSNLTYPAGSAFSCTFEWTEDNDS